MGANALRIVVLAVLLAGCAAPASKVEARPQLQYLDLPSFDEQISASLRSLPRVEVTFHDKVSPSKLPERLQRWLSAVETNGGKVAVIPPPTTVAAKNPLMLVSAVSTLWSAHKMAKEAMEAEALRAAGKYDAELQLGAEGGELVVSRVVFTQRK